MQVQVLLSAAVLLAAATSLTVQCAKISPEGGAIRSLSKREVSREVLTIYHPASNSVRNMGLDPYEERLLIALLGGSIALLFAIVFVFVCCRTYRVARNPKGGGGGGGWGGPRQMMMMHGGGAGGRPTYYYPTGYQPNVAMDPAYLDPARGGYGGPQQQHHQHPGPSSVGQQMQQIQQQHQQQQQLVDNTAYASLGGFDRPHVRKV